MTIKVEELGTGRLYSPDRRDRGYLISAPEEPPTKAAERRYRYWWPSGWWGDQGPTPRCVAYAWLHCIEDGPITWAPRKAGAGPVVSPLQLYNEAQRNDEWPGENYDGTSVRAGAKVLQRLGYIDRYLWAWDLETTLDTILNIGPVVIGSWWYSDMFYPDSEGFIKVGGHRVGGHAYLINGVNLDRQVVRIKNSWGREWGRNGHAYMGFDSLTRLIADHGEVCLPTEKRRT